MGQEPSPTGRDFLPPADRVGSCLYVYAATGLQLGQDGLYVQTLIAAISLWLSRAYAAREGDRDETRLGCQLSGLRLSIDQFP